MERGGPRYGGEPPERHGDGRNRLSEAEDSVIMRKNSLRRQSQGTMMDSDSESESARDNVGGHWEKHPDNLMRRPYDDEDDGEEEAENINFVRRSTPGGFQGRRGAESHGLNDLVGDMDLNALRGRAGYRGPNTPEATLDDLREYDDELNGFSVKDLRSLREGRASMMESVKRPKNHEGRSILEDNLNRIAEHIARLKYIQYESGKTPHGIGAPAARIDSPSRRAPAAPGGVCPFANLDLANLEKRRAETEEQLRATKKYEDKEMFIRTEDRLGDRLESRLEMLDDEIARVKAEQRKADAHSGQEPVFQRRRPQSYSDEESDFQPRGSRHDYPESAAGRSGKFGR